MTLSDSFDERARTLTTALLADAERVPSRTQRADGAKAIWRGAAAFAVTVLIIGFAILGASIALHHTSAANSAPAQQSHAFWSSARIDGTASLVGISCPAANDCVAVDEAGGVLTSTNPSGGAPAWTRFEIKGGARFSAISCPAISFCVAVDSGADVFTSTHPADGASAWNLTLRHYGTRPGTPGSASFNAVSCAGTGFCVAVGTAGDRSSGQVATSTDPGAPTAWNFTNVGFIAPLTSVSCPSRDLCVAVDERGDVLTSTTLTAPAVPMTSPWKTVNVDGNTHLTGVSCPTVSFCIAVDAAGQTLTSTDPTGGARAWSIVNTDAPAHLEAVSCASATLCVAGDSASAVLESSNPAAASSAWAHIYVAPGQSLVIVAVSCAGSQLCVAADDDGSVHVSTNPG